MTLMPNFAARLAHSLTLSAYAPLRLWRLVLMTFLVLVTTGCALWAVAERYRLADHSPSLAEATDFLYAPFLYLVPQFSLANAANLTLPEIVARMTGPLISLLSVVWLLRQRVLVWLVRLLAARRMRGHTVVFGQAASADALALASSGAGDIVVLIDPSFPDDEDREHALGAAGVICLPAPSASLAEARAVVVWQDSDTDNIAAAAALRTSHGLGVEEIDLQVRSVALQNALLQSPDLMLDKAIRLRPHSLSGAALRAALADPRMLELAINRQQPRVTLCLWGMSDALVWAAQIALQQFWSVRLGAPRIIWTGIPAETSLPDVLVQLSRHAEEVFGVGDQCPQVMILSASVACEAADITCHLVDAGDPDATLAQAFALAARLRQAHASPAPVQPILDTACAIGPMFATDKLAFLPPIIPGAGVTVSALRSRDADQKAAEIHLAYDRQFGGGGTAPASGRWQDLPETYVAANRAAADHLAIKQWDAETSGLKGEALIEALAEAEHNRWCAERLLAGWAPAGEGARDNARRLHSDLRPWGALSDEAREKDRGAV
jgi:RyR domain